MKKIVKSLFTKQKIICLEEVECDRVPQLVFSLYSISSCVHILFLRSKRKVQNLNYTCDEHCAKNSCFLFYLLKQYINQACINI